MGSSGDLISPNALTCSSNRTALYFQHNDKGRDAGTVAGSDQRRMSSFLTEAVSYLSPLMDVILNCRSRVFIFRQWEIRGGGSRHKGSLSSETF